ncbi:MAG TPA: hypothetical protein VN282_17675 [Pyrinomonadaceae bacterium]|nr:hypothetical protein [Pyrinomonadaceae bacterium]
MNLTKGALAVVFALLSAAGAQTRVQDDPPPSVERGVNPGAAFANATVVGSFSVRSLPIPTPTSCPHVDVDCPDRVRPGGRLTFVADLSGADPNVTPTFKWKVSVGTITSGQGTSAITVNASEAPGRSVTATVEVIGYERSCAILDSCTTIPGDRATTRKVDEYGNLRYSMEKSRLDVLAIELNNDPMAQGYFICYGGRRTRPGEAGRRCEDAKSYLVSDRGVDPTRVVTIDGGYREVPTVEFWIVPPGTEPPKPTPTIFTTKSKPPTPAHRLGRQRLLALA